jgi:hypothetical protein
MANVNKEPKAFGKSKAELGLILSSVSSHVDKNHPSSNKGYNSLKPLEAGMASLSKRSDAKETFGVF